MLTRVLVVKVLHLVQQGGNFLNLVHAHHLLPAGVRIERLCEYVRIPFQFKPHAALLQVEGDRIRIGQSPQ